MKKVLIYLFVLFSIGLVVYFLRHSTDLLKPASLQEDSSIKSFSTPLKEDKPFVFLIYAQNASDTCEKNLRSIFEQEYENFRLIYIDDGSTDGTLQLAREFAALCEKGKHVTFIKNEKKKGMAASLFQAIGTCRNEEIVLLIEGKDWLAHKGVLRALNRHYADPEIWMTYGQYVSYPSYIRGICAPFDTFRLEKDSFRGHAWVSSHLKTFYAGLFKKIWLEDFLHEGKWIDRSVEMAIMYPMLEMAKEGHYAYIDEVFYICNDEALGQKDRFDLVADNAIESFLRNLPAKNPLSCPPCRPPASLGVDLVLFSFDRCMQLYACLESIERYVTGANKIYVVYRSSSEKFQKSYRELQKRFPQVVFIQESDLRQKSFKSVLLEQVFRTSKVPYVMFGVDSSLVKEKIDLSLCVEQMEKTHAYGFFFRLGDFDLRWDAPSSFITLGNHLYAWQLSLGEREWRFFHDLDLTLYRKEDIYKDFAEMSYKDPNQLRRLWEMRENTDPRLVGLCYDKSKVLHLSGYRNKVFLVPDEFEALFEEGFKIDTKAISQIKNRTSHVDCEVEFIKR